MPNRAIPNSEEWEYTIESGTVWDLPFYRDGYDAARGHVRKMIEGLIAEADHYSDRDGPIKPPEVRILEYLLTNTWFSENASTSGQSDA